MAASATITYLANWATRQDAFQEISPREIHKAGGGPRSSKYVFADQKLLIAKGVFPNIKFHRRCIFCLIVSGKRMPASAA